MYFARSRLEVPHEVPSPIAVELFELAEEIADFANEATEHPIAAPASVESSCFVLSRALFHFPMWNAPPNTIPESQIRREHLRVLKDAIGSEAPNTPEVFEALAYLEAVAIRFGGFRSYRRWLSGEGIAHYYVAMAAIEKQFPE